MHSIYTHKQPVTHHEHDFGPAAVFACYARKNKHTTEDIQRVGSKTV